MNQVYGELTGGSGDIAGLTLDDQLPACRRPKSDMCKKAEHDIMKR